MSCPPEHRVPRASRANLPGWQLQEAALAKGSVSQTSSQPPFRVAQGSDQLGHSVTASPTAMRDMGLGMFFLSHVISSPVSLFTLTMEWRTQSLYTAIEQDVDQEMKGN